MKLARVHNLILYALGEFYLSINQPLTEKPVRLETSKIAFIELLEKSKLISQQERAIYKNLETLEKKRLIEYENKMIKFTEKGLKEFRKNSAEIEQYLQLKNYFKNAEKPKRKLQTVLVE